MSDRNVYALNTVSNVVAKVDPRLLEHPTLGRNLVQVEDPDVCIPCGFTPKNVTTIDGQEIDLTPAEESEPKPRARRTRLTEPSEEQK